MESIDIEEMDCNTCFKMQEILSDEINDPVAQYNPNLSHKDLISTALY